PRALRPPSLRAESAPRDLALEDLRQSAPEPGGAGPGAAPGRRVAPAARIALLLDGGGPDRHRLPDLRPPGERAARGPARRAVDELLLGGLVGPADQYEAGGAVAGLPGAPGLPDAGRRRPDAAPGLLHAAQPAGMDDGGGGGAAPGNEPERLLEADVAGA